jgi:hypothetical protein
VALSAPTNDSITLAGPRPHRDVEKVPTNRHLKASPRFTPESDNISQGPTSPCLACTRNRTLSDMLQSTSCDYFRFTFFGRGPTPQAGPGSDNSESKADTHTVALDSRERADIQTGICVFMTTSSGNKKFGDAWSKEKTSTLKTPSRHLFPKVAIL